MQKYTKFFNNIAELLETGLVSSKDLKEELENSLKFTAEKIIKKLKLVSREEFEVQKELIKKLEKKVDKSKYILNNTILILITLIAILILFDTFKMHLSKFFPNIIPILDSLYESLHDLNLFVKDLFN